MMFDLDKLVADHTVKELESHKKSNIVKIAQPYSLETSYTGQNALIRWVDMVCISLPLHTMSLECDLVTGPAIVGVMPGLPCEGISLLLGNDLSGAKVTVDPVTCITPLTETDAICGGVVTRSAAVKQREVTENNEFLYDLEDTYLNNSDEQIVHLEKLSCSKEKLIAEQNADETLKSCYDNLVSLEEMKHHNISYQLVVQYILQNSYISTTFNKPRNIYILYTSISHALYIL